MVALTQYRKTIKGLPKIDYKADYKNINIAAEDLVSLSIFGKSENRLLDFHRYFNIENKKVVLTPFDTENSETSFLRHNLRIKTIHGMQNLTPEIYMNIVNSMKPSKFVPTFDPAHDCGKNRKKRALKRSADLLKKNVNLLKSDAKTEVLAPLPYLKTVNELREYLTLIQNIKIDGFAFYVKSSFVCSEEFGNLVRSEIWKNKISGKFVLAIGKHIDTLENIDIFKKHQINSIITNFPTNLTKSKIALISQTHQKDIFSTEFAKDGNAIDNNCDCYTCKNHMVCYVHHLLRINELMGFILLEKHNNFVFNKLY